MITVPIVTPDGDLILAGGTPENNYKPFATVWLYHFATPSTEADRTASACIGIWFAVAVAGLAALAYIIVYIRRRRNSNVADESEPLSDKTSELMERISRLMDEERLYLRSDLKVQDIAVRLNTNNSYVSECINSVRGLSFSQFVNACPVRHAQELLRQQPDMKTATVATTSGFSTEASFFRNFKAVTGMTPREWLASL